MANTDHLGRELDTGGEAQTVTQFAVQQGTLDGDAPGVSEAIEDEKRRAEEGTERAQAVSDRMSSPAADSPAAGGDDGDDGEDDAEESGRA